MGCTRAEFLLPRTAISSSPRPFSLAHPPFRIAFSGTSLLLGRRWCQRWSCIRASKGMGLGSFPEDKTEGLVKELRQWRNPQELCVSAEEEKMTIETSVRISADGKLIINGRTVLTGVPANVSFISAAGAGGGAFLGADLGQSGSRHVVPVGTLKDVRFMACFRFKLWWMAQKMGNSGRDVPMETQFLLLELGGVGEETIYTAFLPLLDGHFRACIQGNSDDVLELCIESGDINTKASSFSHLLFIGCANSDPFAAISDAIRVVKHHMNSFRQRMEKQLPPILDCFGWCTWDAFYQDVTQEGVESGLDTLISGGIPPKFVIIDDGWQSTGLDQHDRSDANDKPTLMRLTDIKENPKFQTKSDIAPQGIKNIVNIAKEKYGLAYVYVWHAITGYWGGVRPDIPAMESYNAAMRYPKISPAMMENEPTLKTDVLTVQGLGLVDPLKVFQFYNEMHSHLASAGVDGVKVDVQCILETLGGDLGGRVQLTRRYHQALDSSVAKNFSGNNIIACMSHNTDALYCSKQTAVVRASDDFYPRDPVSHTIHLASVAYNSVFLGEFMVPDWDMFHSLHPAAEYHASARAISGGPIYVSDAPGNHNFQLLRKLVLPDGSILRARLPGRPTKDCLFTDPARDGVSLLKIWNMNKFTGILGVFNCQGAAWSTEEKKNVFHETGSDALTCTVKGDDVHLIAEAATDPEWNGDCVFYRHEDGDLLVLPCNSNMPVSLKVLEQNIFTVSPIKVLAQGIGFAPLGLVEMYNAGGAIDGLSYDINETGNDNLAGETNGSTRPIASAHVEVKGCGKFGAYSSTRPRMCSVDSVEVEFCYDSSSGLLTLDLDDLPKGQRKFHLVVIEL